MISFKLKELIVLETEKCNEDCEWWKDDNEKGC